MNRKFLQNIKVGDASLPDVIIDAIMDEHQRGVDAAKADPGANGGNGGKTFTQEEVNRIVSERLAREREKLVQPSQADEREQALKAREARLDCRDYLDSKKYPVGLIEVLDCSDVEKFKSTADALATQFPAAFTRRPTPPPYAAGTGTQSMLGMDDAISNAFKPHTT